MEKLKENQQKSDPLPLIQTTKISPVDQNQPSTQTNLDTLGSICAQYSLNLDEVGTVYNILTQLKGTKYDIRALPSAEPYTSYWSILADQINYTEFVTEQEQLIKLGEELPSLNIQIVDIPNLSEEEYMKGRLCGRHNYFNSGLDGSDLDQSTIQNKNNTSYQAQVQADRENSIYQVRQQQFQELKELYTIHQAISTT